MLKSGYIFQCITNQFIVLKKGKYLFINVFSTHYSTVQLDDLFILEMYSSK